MFIRLPWPDTWIQLTLPWEQLPLVLRVLLVLALVCVPTSLLMMLYRYELRLVTRLNATALLGLRLLVFVLVLLLVCAQPIYARDRRSTLPGRVVVVVDRSASLDVPDPQRDPADKLRLARALGLTKDMDAKVLERLIEDHQNRRPPRWLVLDEIRGEGDGVLAGKRQKQHDEACQKIDEMTRAEVGRRILDKDGLNVLERLQSKHAVELYVIDREVSEMTAEQLAEARAEGKKGDAAYTDLRGPLVRALERSGPGQGKILGVVVLSDGRHNTGPLPGDKARELGDRGIPIYPVALGERKSPPDVAIVSVRGPNHTVFKDVDADLDVQFKIAGMRAQPFFVEVRREGKERKLLAEKKIEHDGTDRLYQESFPIRMEDVGTQTVTVTIKPVRPEAGYKETIADNNTRSTTIAVADDRARVLLVDGEARWEFHYLHTALQRDRLVQLKSVVFDQPRLDDRLSEEELEKLGLPGRKWPEGPDALANFSCVMLGDVDPERLTLADRQKLEKYVADAGGTLIILGGKRFMPLGYPDRGSDGENDPLRRLLPIESPRVVAPESGFTLALTRAGRVGKLMDLEVQDQKQNEALWAGFPRPWGWAVAGRAKPGATSLAHVPQANRSLPIAERERQDAVIVRHNYGFGRVMFVGIDSTWRFRFRTGDVYHHRFWGQVIRWAAADRPLVVGNEFVRFGTPQPVFRSDEPIELVTRFNETAGELRASLAAGARVLRLDENKPGEVVPVALVPLERRPAQPRVLVGQLQNLPAGKYGVELAVPDLADKLADKDGKPLRATFTILPPESKETTDLERNDDLLQDLATRSGGQVYTPLDVNELAERLKNQGVEHVEHHEQKLWQWWPLLVLIVALLTVEWVGRKMSGLP